MSDLDKKIEARKQEARDKRIAEKAITIARYLGKTTEINHEVGSGRETGFENIFRCEAFAVLHVRTETSGSDGLSGGSILKITTGDKVVFDDGNSFIPGPWELDLDVLYIKARNKEKKANRAEAEAKEEKQRQEEAAKAAKWGL